MKRGACRPSEAGGGGGGETSILEMGRGVKERETSNRVRGNLPPGHVSIVRSRNCYFEHFVVVLSEAV